MAWSTVRELVDFLTPSFEAKQGPLPALGVEAQMLHHLNYLPAGAIRAAVLFRSGVLGQIVCPDRFAIHKLIVADRHWWSAEPLKAEMDRARQPL